MACKAPEEQLGKRRLWGLTAALLGVWIVFIFRHTLSYMYSMDLINDKLFDLKLITVSDYTAAGVITPAQWEYFRQHMLFSVESRARAWLLGGMVDGKDSNHLQRLDSAGGYAKDKDPKPALKFELLLTAELEKAVRGLGVPPEMS